MFCAVRKKTIQLLILFNRVHLRVDRFAMPGLLQSFQDTFQDADRLRKFCRLEAISDAYVTV